MLLPSIEPVGKASACGSKGLIGAKSVLYSKGGFVAHPDTINVTIIQKTSFIELSHYRFWFKKRSMPSAAAIAFELTS